MECQAATAAIDKARDLARLRDSLKDAVNRSNASTSASRKAKVNDNPAYVKANE